MQEREFDEAASAFRDVPRTGVIFVMTEAARKGYTPSDPAWTNFGQGQPEVDAIPGAPKRISEIAISAEDNEYAPVAGLWELREAVANHYNALYRRGMPSQYSAENVCISSGGRAALTRVAASLGEVNLGHFLPDYTAYEELLSLFRLFNPIPILLDPDRGYDFSLEELRREVLGRGLGALLISNPCNPTGKAISGETLRGWCSIARKLDATLILDEFYSHYAWTSYEDDSKLPPTVTAARYVEDVDRDPVVIVNGLTKNWRYPGWRVAWTVGPRDMIDRLASAGVGDQGSHEDRFLRITGPDQQGRGAATEGRDELIGDVAVDDDPTRAGAALPRGREGRTHTFDHRLAQVRVRHDDGGVRSTEFERDDASRVVEVRFEDPPPHRPAAGEEHPVDAGMRGKFRRDRAVPLDEVEDPRGCAGFRKRLQHELGEQLPGRRGLVGRLEDDRVSGEQRGNPVPVRKVRREVEGPHHREHPMRLEATVAVAGIVDRDGVVGDPGE